MIQFGTGGWMLIRFSGTEPILRVFCEMPRREDAIELCERIKSKYIQDKY